MLPRIVLAALVVAGSALRLAGLGWGIPRPLPTEATALRSSYHFDEKDYLAGLARTAPGRGDFDVRDLHWGTLQFSLVWGALGVAEATGFLTRPWRSVFAEPDPENTPRLYRAGRMVSALAGILTLGVVFLIGRRLRGFDTGLAAAAIVAVSPLHVVNSHFLTADVTMVLLLAGAFYCFLGSLDSPGVGPLAASGFLLGLAVSAKYNAVFLAPLWPARDLLDRSRPWRQKLWGYAAMAAGFLLGEPHALARPLQVVRALYREHLAPSPLAVSYQPPLLELAAGQAAGLAWYGLGLAPALAAAAGVILVARRPLHSDDAPSIPKRAALCGATGLAALAVVAGRWPLLRYTLPLIPLLALHAAFALERIPSARARRYLCAVICLPPLLFSMTQIGILVGPHPGDQAAAWIDQRAPAGARIGQLWPELPPLDARRYDLEPVHAFPHESLPAGGLDLDLVVLDNLPLAPWSERFEAVLEARYRLAAEFRAEPRLGSWTVPEPRSPHDWKYTHPVVRIYTRK